MLKFKGANKNPFTVVGQVTGTRYHVIPASGSKNRDLQVRAYTLEDMGGGRRRVDASPADDFHPDDAQALVENNPALWELETTSKSSRKSSKADEADDTDGAE